MTNNIAKLYELAGIKHNKTYKCPNCGSLTAESGILMFGDKVYRCVRCDFKISVLDLNFKDFTGIDRVVWVSPEFTPEKQLELIKWVQLLDNIDNLQMFHHELNNRWCFIVEMLPEFSSIPTERLHCSHEQFEQALASLIIQLRNDLTDKQKEEIKEILK